MRRARGIKGRAEESERENEREREQKANMRNYERKGELKIPFVHGKGTKCYRPMAADLDEKGKKD